MKKVVVIVLCVFLLSCATLEQPQEGETTQGIAVGEPHAPQDMEQIEETTTENEKPEIKKEEYEPQEEYKPPVPQHRLDPELPRPDEMEKLPECNTKFTTYPVDLNKVNSISPIGNLAPPGHTIPTNHMFIHFNPGGASREMFDLFSPAKVWVTHIASGQGFSQDPWDHTIYFALCKDVYGYYNHVKELSPKIQKIVDDFECPSNGHQCLVNVLEPIEEGEIMGKVGRLQGNFDFGLIDLRSEHKFINPERYATRTRHIQCAFDYYEPTLQGPLFSLIDGNNGCGKIFYDIPGTLQGNWWHGDADESTKWDHQLSFSFKNDDYQQAVISIGGIFDSAHTIEVETSSSGIINPAFSRVKVDGTIYCFEDDTGSTKGRVLVRLVDDGVLQIEKQLVSCTKPIEFTKPYTYTR